MRIAFGGIHTECSTYSRIRSRAQDFRVLRGAELRQSPSFQFLNRYAHQFVPLLHARAVPGGPVERATYEEFKTEFLERLRQAGPVDGVYLAMHGAMFVEGLQDAEGDWIEAVRHIVGDACPISASYDLHGNLSRRIINNLDMLSAYRTAPHIDVEETGVRACNMLVHCIDSGIRPSLVWVPVPVLMPGERSSTEDQPAKRLYAQLEQIDRLDGVLDASLLVGYVWADEPRSTASAVMTGTNKEVLAQEARKLAQQYWDAREEFNFGSVRTGSIADCLDWAAESVTQPVILADSGDNPTGGGVGDRAEVLAHLLRRSFQNVLVAGIADLPATDACYAAGVGVTLRLNIGAALDPRGSEPVTVHAKVIFLVETDEPRERQAVVIVDGVTLVLTARRRPFHYIQDFTKLGLSIDRFKFDRFKLLVVKSGYLSPELAPIANPNLMALSDGAINQDIEGLPPNQFRVPTFPFERGFSWTPQVITSDRHNS
ncbi:MAG TPA: M81 family metallopeptidase [Bryobacteraceae bacterium]|nr:M81 family metallopeptidase [Bryobacteraceae bacterium]